jgi:thiol-disulfide isomerase/thioredoxin
MKKIITLVASLFMLTSCQSQETTTFSNESLTTILKDQQNADVSFDKILEKYKGKTILVDVWASWCSDCIKSLPEVNAIKTEFPEVVALNLSVDKSYDKWMAGIEKFEVTGEHYLITDGMKGVFGKSIDLNWIPRFMVIDKTGKIVLYKAIEKDFDKIREALKNNQ